MTSDCDYRHVVVTLISNADHVTFATSVRLASDCGDFANAIVESLDPDHVI